MAKATKEHKEITKDVVPEKVLTKIEIEAQLQDLLQQHQDAQTKVVMLAGAVQIAQQQLLSLTEGLKNDS